MAKIKVINASSRSIRVFMSKYSHPNGSDEWFKLVAGDHDFWERFGWEVIAIEFDDGDRRGIYIQLSWDRTVTIWGKDKIEH